MAALLRKLRIPKPDPGQDLFVEEIWEHPELTVQARHLWCMLFLHREGDIERDGCLIVSGKYEKEARSYVPRFWKRAVTELQERDLLRLEYSPDGRSIKRFLLVTENLETFRDQ